jgi:hypothetical protein
VKTSKISIIRETDTLYYEELKRNGGYLWLVGYLVVFCWTAIVTHLLNTPPLSKWTTHLIAHTVLPTLLLLHIKSNSPATWQYIKACCQGVFDVWKVWPTVFIVAFLWVVAGNVIRVHAQEMFPSPLLWIEQPMYSEIKTNIISSSFANKFSRWLYESLAAGIVEELAIKVFLLLCLPPRVRVFGFLLISTSLTMVTHVSQSIGSISVLALTFAIPTAWYFYRTRNLAWLIIFHVFVDMLLLISFIFI